MQKDWVEFNKTFRVPSVGCFECKETFILKSDHLQNYYSSGLCPACWDKAMKESAEGEIEKLKVDIDNLKCCGNCKLQSDKSCPNYDWDYSNPVHPEGYCPKWKSDKLTREDRDKIDH